MTETLCNHWEQEGVLPEGRTLLSLYLTVGGDEGVKNVVKPVRAALADSPDFVLVPDPWLHITILGLAFLDEHPSNFRQVVYRRLASHLRSLEPPKITFSDVVISTDSVYLGVTDNGELSRIRASLLDAISEWRPALEPYPLPDPPGGFAPHMTVAYSSGTPRIADVRSRLQDVSSSSYAMVVDHIDLVDLVRIGESWQWRDVSGIPIGSP